MFFGCYRSSRRLGAWRKNSDVLGRLRLRPLAAAAGLPTARWPPAGRPLAARQPPPDIGTLQLQQKQHDGLMEQCQTSNGTCASEPINGRFAVDRGFIFIYIYIYN